MIDERRAYLKRAQPRYLAADRAVRGTTGYSPPMSASAAPQVPASPLPPGAAPLAPVRRATYNARLAAVAMAAREVGRGWRAPGPVGRR